MRKHNGMRPQDIAILLKIRAMEGKDWHLVSLSNSLKISVSEISESLNRSKLANLVDHKKKNVLYQNLMEFLEHGIHYVFPQQPGSMARGIPTAHSHQIMKNRFISDVNYVWPANKGEVLGLMIEPLYSRQTEGINDDPIFYKLLAMVDVIRVGKTREVKFAIGELRNELLQ